MEGAQIKELQNPYDALQATDDEEEDDAASVLGGIISEPEQRSLEIGDLGKAYGTRDSKAVPSPSPTPPQIQQTLPSQRTASGSVSMPNVNVGNMSPVPGADGVIVPEMNPMQATSAPPGMSTNPSFIPSPATARDAVRANILQQQAVARSSVPVFQPTPIFSVTGQSLESKGKNLQPSVSLPDQQYSTQQPMQQQYSQQQFQPPMSGANIPPPGTFGLESGIPNQQFPGYFPQFQPVQQPNMYGNHFSQGFPVIANGFHGQYGYSGVPGPYSPVQFSPESAWNVKTKMVTSDSKHQAYERKVKWINDAVELLRVFQPDDTEAEIKKFF